MVASGGWQTSCLCSRTTGLPPLGHTGWGSPSRGTAPFQPLTTAADQGPTSSWEASSGNLRGLFTNKKYSLSFFLTIKASYFIVENLAHVDTQKEDGLILAQLPSTPQDNRR